jgi:hypothetical protein
VRVLVAAPYPPAPDAAALEAVRAVERFVAEGHEVEVLSPLPSAAGAHGPLAGLRGAMTLAGRARRFDLLYLQVGRHMLFRPEAPRLWRIVDSVALAAALRCWRRTTADAGDLSDVPGSGGGLSGRIVWGAIDEVIVSSSQVRSHLSALAHIAASRISVRPPQGRPREQQDPGEHGAGPPPHGAAAPPPELPPWRTTTPPDWDDLMAQVRARAVRDRESLEAPARPDAGDRRR